MPAGVGFRDKLRAVEDSIIGTLASAAGSVLDDERAVDALNAARALAADITRKQAATAQAEQRIDEARAPYASAARQAAVLFFATARLVNVDVLCHFSLPWFLQRVRDAVSEVCVSASAVSVPFWWRLGSDVCHHRLDAVSTRAISGYAAELRRAGSGAQAARPRRGPPRRCACKSVSLPERSSTARLQRLARLRRCEAHQWHLERRRAGVSGVRGACGHGAACKPRGVACG